MALHAPLTDISRQLLYDNIVRAGYRPALVHMLQCVSLRIHKEQNHQLPHFHLEFKKEYSASYAIETGQRLAGQVPSRYEKAMLTWAKQNSALLIKVWNSLNRDEPLELSLPAGRAVNPGNLG
jgi:hypothetical protein